MWCLNGIQGRRDSQNRAKAWPSPTSVAGGTHWYRCDALEGRVGTRSLTTLANSHGLRQAPGTNAASAYFCTTCRLYIFLMVGGNRKITFVTSKNDTKCFSKWGLPEPSHCPWLSFLFQPKGGCRRHFSSTKLKLLFIWPFTGGAQKSDHVIRQLTDELLWKQIQSNVLWDKKYPN